MKLNNINENTMRKMSQRKNKSRIRKVCRD